MDPMDRVRAYEQAAAEAGAALEASNQGWQEAQVEQFEKEGWTDAAARAKAQLSSEVAVEAEVEAEPEDEDDVGDTGTGPYEGRTRLQLVQVARTKGIKGAAAMRKDELIDELREG